MPVEPLVPPVLPVPPTLPVPLVRPVLLALPVPDEPDLLDEPDVPETDSSSPIPSELDPLLPIPLCAFMPREDPDEELLDEPLDDPRCDPDEEPDMPRSRSLSSPPGSRFRF